jgi:hypothetical protein
VNVTNIEVNVKNIQANVTNIQANVTNIERGEPKSTQSSKNMLTLLYYIVVHIEG